MTPQEKATALYNKYYACLDFVGCNFSHYTAKQCALIAVEEILKEKALHSTNSLNFWDQVKTEIEKL